MSFEPINSDHAIQSCQFGFALSRAVKHTTLQSIFEAHPHWMQLLPAISMGNASEFEAEAVTPLSPTRSKQGLLSAYLQPNGSADWQFRIFHNQVDVICSRYTRWDHVWSQAKQLFGYALGGIQKNEKDLRVVSVGLRVVDHFSTGESYNLSELFKPNDLLPKSVYGSKRMWHCHLGWFDDPAESSNLSHINFDALHQTIVSGPGDEMERTIIQIVHTLQYRLTADASDVTEWLVTADVIRKIERAMSDHHASNKSLLRALLHKSMADRIGLGTHQ
jgi:uncharacterized protein (TIGR04255 family)